MFFVSYVICFFIAPSEKSPNHFWSLLRVQRSATGQRSSRSFVLHWNVSALLATKQRVSKQRSLWRSARNGMSVYRLMKWRWKKRWHWANTHGHTLWSMKHKEWKMKIRRWQSTYANSSQNSEFFCQEHLFRWARTLLINTQFYFVLN